MKRTCFLACIAATIAALTTGSDVRAQEARLRLVSFVPGNSSFGFAAKRWVDETNRRGRGIVRIDFAGPEAIPVTEQPNAVKTGVIDMHSGPPTWYHGMLIEAEILPLSDITIPEMKKNGAWNYLNKLHRDKMNVHLLTTFYLGVDFHIYTTKPANVADKAKPFAGFVLRGPPYIKAFFESLGAQPLSIPPGEMYTALERNLIQGYAWPLWGVKDFGWLKLTKYRYDPGTLTSAVSVMINLDRWNKLDKRQQQLLTDMANWGDMQWPKWLAETNDAEKKIQADARIQTVDLGPDFRNQARDIFWKELEAASPQHIPHLKKLVTKP